MLFLVECAQENARLVATEVRARASSMIAKRAIDSASLFSQREAQLERENEILQDNTRALFNEAKARQARAASARRGAHVSALPSARRVRGRRLDVLRRREVEAGRFAVDDG